MSSVHLHLVEIHRSLVPDESIVHAQCVTKLQNMAATTIIVFWRKVGHITNILYCPLPISVFSQS